MANFAVAEKNERKTLGLVLSGGGARGIAHVGVLKALEELRVPVDYISGTSMGAIAGGYYAAGVEVSEMEKWVAEADWDDLFEDRTARDQTIYANKIRDANYVLGVEYGLKGRQMQLPTNFISGRKLLFELRKMTFGNEAVRHFDEFMIPFRAVATDMETGERVVLDRGDLAMVLRSSIAFPGLVAPAEIDGRLLGDGFLTDNLPVDVAWAMGADYLVAVDVGETLRDRTRLNDPLGMTRQAMAIMGRRNTERQISLLTENDLLITPNLEGVSATGFNNTTRTIQLGYEAVMAQKDYFTRFALDEKSYADWSTRRIRRPVEEITVEKIFVEKSKRLSEETIRKRLGIKESKPFDFDELERGLGLVYDLGNLKMVDYRIFSTEKGNALLVETQEDRVGPNYVRFGFDFATDLSGESEFTLRIQHDRTELNDLGAKLRFDFAIGEDTLIGATWEQPLEYERSFSWKAESSYQTNKITAREADGFGQLANTEAFEFGLFAIKDFTNYAGFQVGPFVRQNFHDAPYREVRAVGGVAAFDFDKLNSLSFPTTGVRFNFGVESSYKNFGANESYNKFYGGLWLPYTFRGHNTILLSVKGAGKMGRDLPELEKFELGGFGSLSGTAKDSLYDQFAGRALIAYYKKLDDLPTKIGRGLYGGFTFELGGVWEDTRDIDLDSARWGTSVFLGADTFIGPLYLGYGVGEGNEQSLYLYMGSIW